MLFNKTRQYNIQKGPKTDKTDSILNYIKTNKVKKECYLMNILNCDISLDSIFS